METNENQFGVNFWWYVPQNIVFDAGEAQEILGRHGFESFDLPAPTRRTEVSRTAYHFQDRRTKDNRRITEKARDDDNTVVYGILSRDQRGDQVGYQQNTKVVLHKDTGHVGAEGALAGEFMNALKIYEGSITSEDIRHFLRAIVVNMTYGIPKRPSGGIYFVPVLYVPILEQANDFLKELGVGAKLYIERLVSGVSERENVWESVQAEIESKITDTLATVERIGKRVSSVGKHQTRLDGLSEIMEVYKGLLGQEAKHEELAKMLNEAGEKVSSKLMLLSEQAESNGTGTLKKSRRVLQAEEILEACGRPMTIQELTDAGIASGVFSGDIANPVGSVNATITKALNAGTTRIIRVGRGIYGFPE